MWKSPDEDRYDADLQVPQVRAQTGLMVWGLISAEGGLCLRILEGRQNSEKYEKILFENLIPILENIGDYVFVQDNCSIHISERMKHFFERENVLVEELPSRSPDLNIIENLWTNMKRYITRYQPKNIEDLKILLRESFFVCANTEFCSKLYASIPDRLKEIIAKGGCRIRF